MKRFVAVFIGSEDSENVRKWESLDEKTREAREKEGIQAWHNWVKKNERAIVEGGSPLGTTKKVGPKGISDTKNEICAYTVVQAGSHEEAASIFIDHPHFKIFPGDSVEVMECLPVPEM